VNVSADLWEDLKVSAIRRKMTTGEAVERAIRLWINTGESAAA